MTTATDAHSTEPGGIEPGAGAHAVHPDHAEGDFEHAHKPDVYYVKIAIFLSVLTALEVTLKYVDIGSLFLPVLFILMAIKFVTVVLFFMHLKFDSKWFNMVFWTGLGLAITVYCIALTTFKFWSS